MDSVTALVRKPLTTRIYDFFNKHTLLCLTVFLTILSFFVYHEFILGDKYYIPFDDIASDAYSQALPTAVYQSEYLWSEGVPMWAFSNVLGQNFYPSLGDPLRFLIVLSGKDAVPYMFGLIQFVRPILAGVFFYLYLQKVTKSNKTAFLFAILYAFCAHMIARGAWPRFPSELVWGALVVYAIELFVVDRKWQLLPLAVALFGISLQAFTVLVFIVIFFCYMLIRLYSHQGWQGKKTITEIFKYIGVYCIGLALAAFIVFPGIYNALNAARVSGDLSIASNLSSTPVFTHISGFEAFSMFFSTFSMDALGVGYEYTGPVNYLESPMFYCGVLTILVLPQVFFMKDKKKRNGIILLCAICLIYWIFPYFKFMMGGFYVGSYRDTALVIFIALLYCAANIFEDVILAKKANIPVLIGTFAAVACIGIAGISRREEFGFVFNKPVLLWMGVFICAYIVIMLCLRAKKGMKAGFAVLVCLVVLEVGVYANISVNGEERDYLTEEVMQNMPFAGQAPIIDEIKDNDTGLYRMETDFNRYYVCDPLYNDYLGTRGYTMLTKYTQAFLSNMEAGKPLNQNSTNFSTTYIERTGLTNLLGMKYILTKTDAVYFPGYELAYEEEGYYAFENQYALPFGLAFDQYVLPEDFNTLDNVQKDIVLGSAVVLDHGQEAGKALRKTDTESLLTDYSTYDLEKINVEYNSIDVVEGTLSEKLIYAKQAGEPEAYIDLYFDEPVNIAGISFVIHNNNGVTVDGQYVSIKTNHGETLGDPGNSIFYSAISDEAPITIEIMKDNVTALRLGLRDIEQQRSIGSLVITVSRESVDDTYYKSLETLKKSGLEITGHSRNTINGNVTVQSGSMLMIPTAYDEGWKAKVDGVETEVEVVDFGLLGVYLEEGHHNITLSYFPPWLKEGLILTFIGVGAYILLLVRVTMKKKVRKVNE